MATLGIKSFYRQQKKSGAGRVTGKRSGKPAAVGSDPITLVPSSSPNLQDLRAKDEFEGEKLRQFDLDMSYGPCIGLTRMERWDRASSMGLSPPADVEAILLRLNGGDRAGPNECLWEGRV